LLTIILQVVQIHFLSFDLEHRYDQLRVYDGYDAVSPLLYTFTGASLPSDVLSNRNIVFVSFTTDSSETRGGFKIVYSTSIPVPG